MAAFTKMHSPKLSANSITAAVFEWRRDMAQEALDIERCAPWRARARGGSKRAHLKSAYAALRTYFLCVIFSPGYIYLYPTIYDYRYPPENHGVLTFSLVPWL